MDKIILGLLMLRRLTLYEIRAIIKSNLGTMCSDGMGSIQSALKKLLSAEFIACYEFVEKSVNKKQYSITDKGRSELLCWLQTPADLTNAKNMELGKFFFMGLLPAAQRPPLIGEIVSILEKELAEMQKLQSAIQLTENKKQVLDYWENDKEYAGGIQAATQTDITESVNSIGDFQMLTLQYAIDLFKFNIEWFKKINDSHGREA